MTLATAVAGDPARPPVVLIHGYPDTSRVWAPVMERLSRDFHVVAYDVRGAGGSSAPRDATAYDLTCLADDFHRVCEALIPGRPVHLVGHDWGGIQGWEFVSDPRFAGRIASFTSIAGPALRGAPATGSAAGRLRTLLRMRRSWYIAVLCLPGGPALMWRVLFAGGRWRRFLSERERLSVDESFPAATVTEDGLRGAGLYRQNIRRRPRRRHQTDPPHAPVQLIVPTGDRFIPASYYAAATRLAPGLRRREIGGSHWALRAAPELIAAWIAEFAASAAAVPGGGDAD